MSVPFLKNEKNYESLKSSCYINEPFEEISRFDLTHQPITTGMKKLVDVPQKNKMSDTSTSNMNETTLMRVRSTTPNTPYPWIADTTKAQLF